jgi:hypothetical protein
VEFVSLADLTRTKNNMKLEKTKNFTHYHALGKNFKVKKKTSFEVICAKVSKAVQKRDEFFKKHRRTLEKMEKLERDLLAVAYFANEKTEILEERGKLDRATLHYTDKYVEISFRSNKGLITIDIFEKMRYNGGTK